MASYGKVTRNERDFRRIQDEIEADRPPSAPYEYSLVEKERIQAMTNFSYFRRRVCNYQDFQPFHQKIDDCLLRPTRYKMITIPRNHLKSSDVMAWLLYTIVKNPDVSILYESSIYAQAKKYISEMRGHLESPRFTSLWGDCKGSPWTDSAITVSSRKQLQPAPTISASGLDKAQTGQHYDIVVLDDIVDELNSRTTEGRQKGIDRYRQALSLLRPNGTILIVGTPWDSEDLYAWLQNQPPIINMFDFVKLDIYDRDGNILFPTKYCETLAEEKVNPGKRSFEGLRLQLGAYVFSCQYRINPIAEDFSEFKKTWLKHDPVAVINSRIMHSQGELYIFCDPALGKERSEKPCDTAITIGHFMPEGKADLVWEDVALYDPGATIDKLHFYACKYSEWKKDHVTVFIENVGFQDYMITQLEKKRSEGGIYYKIEPAPPKGDKHKRIRGLMPYYRNGQITHSEVLRGGVVERQLERFPKDRMVDGIDAWSQFVTYARFPHKEIKKDPLEEIDGQFGDATKVWNTMRAPLDRKKPQNTNEDISYTGKKGEYFSIG